MNRQEKTLDVPWRFKCRRLVDHVCSVCSSGSAMDKMKKWETKMMMRLFRFKGGKDKTWVEFHTRFHKDARKFWIKLDFFFSV